MDNQTLSPNGGFLPIVVCQNNNILNSKNNILRSYSKIKSTISFSDINNIKLK